MRKGFYLQMESALRCRWSLLGLTSLCVFIIHGRKVTITFSQVQTHFLKCHLLECWKHNFSSLLSNPSSLAPGPATQPKSHSEVFQNNFSAKTNSIILGSSALFTSIFFSFLTFIWSQILRICPFQDFAFPYLLSHTCSNSSLKIIPTLVILSTIFLKKKIDFSIRISEVPLLFVLYFLMPGLQLQLIMVIE